MAKRQKRSERIYSVRPGYACRCGFCEDKRAGQGTRYPSRSFCAGCGHGYSLVGTDQSGCHKCGTTGQWLQEKPTLPFMPKPEAIDAVLAEARAACARLADVYRPEHIERNVEVDYFGLIATLKRMESALAAMDASATQETQR